MIRFAKITDIESIVRLWNEAFGDGKEEIMFFLNNKFIPENTIVCEYNNEIVSMLFLLEGKLIIKNKAYSSYYLYAACTAENQRGRGLMAQLLEKARITAKDRQKYFICLMPGEESLFDFYKRFGYKTIFSRKILNIEVSDTDITSNEPDSEDTYTLEQKRKNAFSNYDRFEWDAKSIDFACKSNLLYGGSLLNSRKGYALYAVNSFKTVVKEFAFSSDDFNSATSKIISKTNCMHLTFFLPADYPTDIGSFEIKKSAMALAVKEEYENIISGIENAYLGLTLD